MWMYCSVFMIFISFLSSGMMAPVLQPCFRVRSCRTKTRTNLYSKCTAIQPKMNLQPEYCYNPPKKHMKRTKKGVPMLTHSPKTSNINRVVGPKWFQDSEDIYTFSSSRFCNKTASKQNMAPSTPASRLFRDALLSVVLQR